MQNSTYYAELHLEGHDGSAQLDARPSDSIAIALRLDAPIFADESLLGALDDADASSANDASMLEQSTSEELTSEQLKQYLAKLQPEDFGKFSP